MMMLTRRNGGDADRQLFASGTNIASIGPRTHSSGEEQRLLSYHSFRNRRGCTGGMSVIRGRYIRRQGFLDSGLSLGKTETELLLLVGYLTSCGFYNFVLPRMDDPETPLPCILLMCRAAAKSLVPGLICPMIRASDALLTTFGSPSHSSL